MTTNYRPGVGANGSTHPKEAVARTAGVVSMAVLAVGLGGLALGIEWAWVAFPVGYGGVLPLAVSRARSRVTQNRNGGTDTSGEEDALATLRNRYARGDIDDAEFERRVERLLETGDRN